MEFHKELLLLMLILTVAVLNTDITIETGYQLSQLSLCYNV